MTIPGDRVQYSTIVDRPKLKLRNRVAVFAPG
jgi:hypothetical protein